MLLDTQIFLWWAADAPQLPVHLRAQIETADTLYLSAASIWEVQIKVGTGKLR